jgi:hypothetical protein
MTRQSRRHLPPPKANFEKLQDILLKRKGLTLDVSSSGALAASLDDCVVCILVIDIHGQHRCRFCNPCSIARALSDTK